MIDSGTLSRLATILDEACEELGSSCFLIGRLALASQFSGKSGGEKLAETLDADFAIMVKSWAEYQALRNHLEKGKEGDFQADGRQTQRLIYSKSIAVDLVPAGGVADGLGRIHWPPDGSPVMGVHGFDDAFADAEQIDIGDARIRVASPRGLALLKLIAWNDRQDRTKDIEDLAFILRRYENFIGDDRLYNGIDSDLIAEEGFDYNMAWARILGRDIGRMIIRPAAAEILRSILTRELAEPFNLANPFQKFMNCDFERAVEYLSNLSKGFCEGLKDR